MGQGIAERGQRIRARLHALVSSDIGRRDVRGMEDVRVEAYEALEDAAAPEIAAK